MAEIVKDVKFKVIKLKLVELIEINPYAMGICDSCGQASFDGYYIAVLNSYYCPKCYEDWLKRAVYYPEDAPIEEKNFAFWKNELQKKGFLDAE